MTNLKTYLNKNWFDDPKSNILSGIVVAFAMIPEAIAFSGIAGVDPKVGLFGAFCLSITTVSYTHLTLPTSNGV